MSDFAEVQRKPLVARSILRNGALREGWDRHQQARPSDVYWRMVARLVAKEIAHDVEDGAVEGDWPVEVFHPNGQLSFTGRLSSVKLGSCLKLNWIKA